MKKKKIIWYDPKLIPFARELRNHSTKSEIIFWLKIKGKAFYGYDFHRQKPIDNYILDFYCDALLLGIEIDGYSHQILEVFNKDTKKEQRLNEFWHLDCARCDSIAL